MSSNATVPPLDPQNFRADFPILDKKLHGDQPLVFLDNAASTQRPRQVIEVMVDAYERYYANVHRGIHALSEETTDRYEAARETVRVFLNARDVEEIVFTAGTTASINTVARSWGDVNLGEGDEIVLSVMEHHSNLVPWQQLASRTGCVLRHIPISDDGRLDLDGFDRLLTSRTRLVAITAVSNVLGTINPIDELTRRAHQAGALTLVDAAQHVPHAVLDVQQVGADFVAFSGHKMLGPTGVGILYGRREVLEQMPPFQGGGSMIHDVYLDRFTPADIPTRFEAGTPPIVQAIGLATAIDYLTEIGLPAIAQHERLLTRHAHHVLSEIDGIRLLGPSPEEKAGIVSFLLDKIHAHDIAQILDRYGVAVRAGHHCTQPLHQRLGIRASTRASFYLYNTLAEIDQLGSAIEETKRVFRPRKRVSR
ncbi:MAG: aminotransferase class V-fold PLP-dependent enzyme [Pirellulales bacterium]